MIDASETYRESMPIRENPIFRNEIEEKIKKVERNYLWAGSIIGCVGFSGIASCLTILSFSDSENIFAQVTAIITGTVSGIFCIAAPIIWSIGLCEKYNLENE